MAVILQWALWGLGGIVGLVLLMLVVYMISRLWTWGRLQSIKDFSKRG